MKFPAFVVVFIALSNRGKLFNFRTVGLIRFSIIAQTKMLGWCKRLQEISEKIRKLKKKISHHDI